MKLSIPTLPNASLKLILCSVILAVFVHESHGQQAQPLTLTLLEAVHIATTQNPNIQMAIVDSSIAKEEQRKALASLLPQVRIDATASQSRLDALGNSDGGPFRTVSAGPQVSIPLFNAADLGRYHARQAYSAAAVADAQTVREQIAGLTVSQYLLCVRLAATTEAAESQVALAKRLWDQAIAHEQAGSGTSLDTLRAKQKAKVQQQSLIRAQQEEEVGNFSLVRFLSLPPTTKIILADKEQLMGQHAIPEDQRAMEIAWTQRPEMIALQERIAAATKELASARGERLPSLNVNGAYGQEGGRMNDTGPAYQCGISVSVPIFTGGEIRAKVAAATLRIEHNKQEQNEFRNRIALEVLTALAQLRASTKEVGVANEGLDLAQQEVMQAQDRFQSGASDNIEVVTAQDTLAQAYEAQIAALYRVNQAQADLARAMGHVGNVYK